LNQNLGSPESDRLDALGKMLCGPARHSPVAKGDVKLQNLPWLFLIKIVATQRRSRDCAVPLFSSILLRDGNVDEVSRLDE
jgi:hypothetical protein